MPVWKADGVCVCFEFGWRWCEDIRFFSSLHSAGEIFLVCYRTTRAWCAYRRINALAKAVRWLTKRWRAHTKFYAMHCSLLAAQLTHTLNSTSLTKFIPCKSHIYELFSLHIILVFYEWYDVHKKCVLVGYLLDPDWILLDMLSFMYKYSTASFISWVGLLYVNLQKITLSG